MRSHRGFRLEQLEDRVALSGAVHLQGAMFEIVQHVGPPIFVQVSGVLTPSGHLNVKLDRSSINGPPIIPSDPMHGFLHVGPDAPLVEFTGFLANDQIHAVIPPNPIVPPPVT